ncbi:MAG: diguanylate cyclase [Pseudomonadota bacterium]
MKIFNNIRAKVWGCVWIALCAYLLATLATSIANIRISDSLTILEEVHFPLALKGEKAFTMFSEQTKNFESSLLTGENDDLVKAELFHSEIMDLLNEQILTASSRNTSSYPKLLALRDSYEDYYTLAIEQYRIACNSGDPFAQTQQMLRIGKLRAHLISNFRNIAGELTQRVIDEITNNKTRAAENSRLLQILFIAVLLIITWAINHVANNQLIRPLKQLKMMIDNFSRGKQITRPEICNEKDEICQLALSFWDMTEELKNISVSKEYLDSIIMNMSDSLIVLATNHTISQINQSALNLLSFDEKDILHKPVQRILAPSGTFIHTVFDELSQGKSITNIELNLKSGDNETIPVLFSGTPFYTESGQIEGIICLARDIRELKDELVTKEKISNYDPLTSLPNRTIMQDRLTHALQSARRYNKMVAILLLNIDNLVKVIDTYGHETGDRIIVEMANAIRATIRDTDTLARMKKDQFAVILGSLNDRNDGDLVIEKIISKISHEPQVYAADPIVVNAGVAYFPDDGSNAVNLIEKSTIALSRSRKNVP